MQIPTMPQQSSQQQNPVTWGLDGILPAARIQYNDLQPTPAPQAAPALRPGVDVLPPSPQMSAALQSAYAQNPTMPKGMLEAIAMQESSMGTNRANYNPSIGKYAWMFGMTPVAQKELATRGIRTDLDSPGGAARAAAAYLSLSQGKYGDNASWYKQGYNGSTSMPFNPGKFSSMIDYYAKGSQQAQPASPLPDLTTNL